MAASGIANFAELGKMKAVRNVTTIRRRRRRRLRQNNGYTAGGVVVQHDMHTLTHTQRLEKGSKLNDATLCVRQKTRRMGVERSRKA